MHTIHVRSFKVRNLKKRKIHIAQHHMPNSSYACILPHAY